MDYKELIDRVKSQSQEWLCYNEPRLSHMLEEAADAIETLLSERDAAVQDLHRMHTLCMDIGGCCPECGAQIDDLMDAACSFCSGSQVSCWKDDPSDDRRCADFNWRGPQKGEPHASR